MPRLDDDEIRLKHHQLGTALCDYCQETEIPTLLRTLKLVRAEAGKIAMMIEPGGCDSSPVIVQQSLFGSYVKYDALSNH